MYFVLNMQVKTLIDPYHISVHIITVVFLLIYLHYFYIFLYFVAAL